ncbi:DNA ligase [Acrasis kona]|uniref:DNA ligase n=1 Tax=Acrasis kona TaxID=1008807 RepID=A0AAW2Z2J6_9EUKA
MGGKGSGKKFKSTRTVKPTTAGDRLTIFKDLVIYIDVDEDSVYEELQGTIKENGGSITRSLARQPNCIVFETGDAATYTYVEDKTDVQLWTPDWVRDCISVGELKAGNEYIPTFRKEVDGPQKKDSD